MVFLYLGTLLVVIGYHNPWVAFVKFIGILLAVAGVLSLTSVAMQLLIRTLQRAWFHHQVGENELSLFAN